MLLLHVGKNHVSEDLCTKVK